MNEVRDGTEVTVTLLALNPAGEQPTIETMSPTKRLWAVEVVTVAVVPLPAREEITAGTRVVPMVPFRRMILRVWGSIRKIHPPAATMM